MLTRPCTIQLTLPCFQPVLYLGLFFVYTSTLLALVIIEVLMQFSMFYLGMHLISRCAYWSLFALFTLNCRCVVVRSVVFWFLPLRMNDWGRYFILVRILYNHFKPVSKHKLILSFHCSKSCIRLRAVYDKQFWQIE